MSNGWLASHAACLGLFNFCQIIGERKIVKIDNLFNISLHIIYILLIRRIRLVVSL